MTRQAVVYRVLVASPSDVIKERQAVVEVIQSWNAVNSKQYGVMLEAVLWETHSTPEMGNRPQEIINKQIVRESDILVGVFWTHIGTQTGEAASGTIEEINEFEKEGKPVLLYFSSAPVVPESIDQEQYGKLIKFKEECKGKGLINQYESVGVFRENLLRHLTSTIDRVHLDPKTHLPVGKKNKEDEGREKLNAFLSQYGSFLRRLEAEWSAEKDSQPMNIDGAKYILSRAFDDVVGFKSQIVSDHGTGLLELLTEAAKQLKIIQKNRLSLDGGMSYRCFWEEGDSIITTLKKVPEIIGSISNQKHK